MATKPIETPKGVAVGYTYLNRPDMGRDHFAHDFGHYKVKLAMDLEDEAVQKFIKKLEAARDELFEQDKAKYIEQGKKGLVKKMVKRPVYEAEEDDDGEETGRALFMFRVLAGGVTKEGRRWDRTMKFYNAAGKELPQAPILYSGSILKLMVDINAYAKVTEDKERRYSVSFRFNDIQVIKQVAGGASAAAFSSEEDDEDAEDITAFSSEEEDTGNSTVQSSGNTDMDDHDDL